MLQGLCFVCGLHPFHLNNNNLYCWHCTIVGRFCPPIVLSRDKQLFSPCRWTTKTELLSPISVQVNIMPALIHVGRWWEYCCLHPGQKCPWIGKKRPWIVLSTDICPPIVLVKQRRMPTNSKWSRIHSTWDGAECFALLNQSLLIMLHFSHLLNEAVSDNLIVTIVCRFNLFKDSSANIFVSNLVI